MKATTRRAAAFTLVELLVVIGIIALLISILLPGLNKARQQANLLKCASNQRAIGQLFAIYASESKGFFPRSGATYGMGWQDPGPNPNDASNPQNNTHAEQGRVAFWPDLLSLLANRRGYLSQIVGATGSGSGVYSQYTNLGNADMLAADFAGVFHDTDLPLQDFAPRVSTYFVNMRIVAPQNAKDRAYAAGGGNAPAYHFNPQQNSSKIHHSAAVMMMWCAPVSIINNKIDITQYDSASWNLDNYTYSNGTFYITSAASRSYFVGDKNYLTNKIGIGSLTGESANNANVTKTGLKAANIDCFVAGGNTNSMRFRHNNNTTVNALFADGHVGSRTLGDVYARDICLEQ